MPSKTRADDPQGIGYHNLRMVPFPPIPSCSRSARRLCKKSWTKRDSGFGGFVCWEQAAWALARWVRTATGLGRTTVIHPGSLGAASVLNPKTSTVLSPVQGLEPENNTDRVPHENPRQAMQLISVRRHEFAAAVDLLALGDLLHNCSTIRYLALAP